MQFTVPQEFGWIGSSTSMAAEAIRPITRWANEYPTQDGFDREAQRWSENACRIEAQSLPKRFRIEKRENKIL